MTPEPVELQLTGTFDMPAARKLCDDLIGEARTCFLVDVSQVRDLHPDALAHLCRAVSLLRGRVAMRGLSRQHFRLLAYLGAPLPRRGMARRRQGARVTGGAGGRPPVHGGDGRAPRGR